jgi:hypothetical protein
VHINDRPPLSMDTTAAPQRSTPALPLTPFDILEAIKIVAPTEFVTVSGKVTELRNTGSTGTNSMIYGEIQDFTSKDTISFACPRSHAPEATGQCVEIRGTIRHQVNFRRNAITVELNGKVLRKIEPPKNLESQFPELTRSSPRTPLMQFVAERSHMNLIFVGTEVAIEDALKGLRQAGVSADTVAKFPTVTAKMSYEEGICNGLSEAIRRNPEAIALLRGGNDSTLGIWNQPTVLNELLKLKCPCYLALGHERFISAADQIVDQSFSNPFDLGSSFGKAMLDRAAELKKNKLIEKLQLEIDEIQTTLQSVEIKGSELEKEKEAAVKKISELTAAFQFWRAIGAIATAALILGVTILLAR